MVVKTMEKWILQVRGEARWIISERTTYFCRQGLHCRTLVL